MKVDLQAKGVRLSAESPNKGIGFSLGDGAAAGPCLSRSSAASTATSSTCTPRRQCRAAASSVRATSPRRRVPTGGPNLYVTTKGRAAIGPVTFVGRVTRGTRTGTVPARSHRIFSVNTVADAQKGRITYVNSDLASTTLGMSCTVVSGTTGKAGRVVVSVLSGVTYLHRQTGSHWALVACGGTGESWLGKWLLSGDALTLSMTFDKGLLLHHHQWWSGTRRSRQGIQRRRRRGHRPQPAQPRDVRLRVGQRPLRAAGHGRRADQEQGRRELQGTDGLSRSPEVLHGAGVCSTVVDRRPSSPARPGTGARSCRTSWSECTLRPVPNGLYVFGR